jgi:hypothetical protein
VTACATIPSLLDHPDVVPSVYLRGRRKGRPRVAVFFDGE